MSKPRLVILDSYTAVTTGLSLDALKEMVEVCAIYERTLQEDCVRNIGDAELVIINKTTLDSDILSRCPNLKYIGIFATGYNQVDIDYCKKHGIVVSNVPGYSTNGVAQLSFTLILDLLFLTAKHDREVHEGKWGLCEGFSCYDPRISEINGKTLGLVGFGNIGKQMAKISAGFDMEVLVYSRTHYPAYESEHLKFVDFDTMLKKSDIISLHVPLFDETAKLIDETAIAKMKQGALLINTARGGIIDEQAVADALNSGKLGGAGLDVFTQEPISGESPLLNAQNCILTPHIAWSTVESRSRLIEIVLRNIHAYLEGHPHNNVAARVM